MKRLLLSLIGTVIILSLVCGLKLATVQNDIRNRPIEITDLADSGYTSQGVYGHGNLVLEGGEYDWYIYDIAAPNGRVQKVCANGKTPEPQMDIDFIHFKDSWYKLRSGTMYLSENAMRSEPETHKWRGLFSSKIAFPVRRPDFPYRVKIISDKLRYKSLSPLEYVQGLRTSNPSCADIPAP